MEENKNGAVEGSHLSSADSKKFAPKKPLNTVAIICAVVGLVLGFVISGFVGGGKALNKTTLDKNELDTVVATYNGTNKVTARDVLESSGSLENAKVSEDTYHVPSADAIIAYVRNQILLDEAKKAGVEATDDDIAKFAKENLGVEKLDYDELAKKFGVDGDSVKEVLKQTVTISKLHDSKLSKDKDSDVTPPAEPEKCEEGKEQVKTAAYADYIKKLAGSEWDAENNKWASDDSMYASVMGESGFDGSEASYEMAVMAFNVAYQQFAASQQKANSGWIDFVNKVYAESSVNVYTLMP